MGGHFRYSSPTQACSCPWYMGPIQALSPAILRCIILPDTSPLLRAVDATLSRIAPLFVASIFLSTALCGLTGPTNTGKTRLRRKLFGIGFVNATQDCIVSETCESEHVMLLIWRIRIVGGGTAGLANTSRLAAANISIMVVEVGNFYEFDNGNTCQVSCHRLTYLSLDKLAKITSLWVGISLLRIRQHIRPQTQVKYVRELTLALLEGLSDRQTH